ncbi:DNA-binding protein [Pseudomonas resinovorans]|uniref:DNA-binding protein n=1 Tax=Metapseudomonas resinovorans TaxID=53412 RepID=A0ABT4YBG0_METRE|nr:MULTISPECIES: DNA-binding protein [Pseudomonas]MDA8485964.1 DNA-binding protein [Pseudomonas resinovorans]MDH4871364.1 DNA-binding protein [Pseudomonas sp. BN515]
MDEIRDRAVLLIRMAGPKKLSLLGETNHERWKNISKGAIRMSTEEIGVLVKMYPQYALWLASGEVAPEAGQTSPAYDEAHSNLPTPNAG